MNYHRAAYELAVARVAEKLHEASSLSRAELARALAMPELEVTRLEHGSQPLSAGALLVLRKLYGVGWPELEAAVEAELPEAQRQLDTAGHARPK